MKIGSGNWVRMHRRTRVDECLCLDISTLGDDGLLDAGAGGIVAWSKQNVTFASIHVACRTIKGHDCLALTYVQDGKHSVKLNIQLQFTTPHFGGTRWWFTCPHPDCGRRVGNLYYWNSFWACRVCHKLTYRSSQTAHAEDRMRRYEARKLGLQEDFFTAVLMSTPML